MTAKQSFFLNVTSDEVLFGGAAGGGKSYAQLVDALVYAVKYPKSKQLILRRTYPELESSLILQHLEFYPKDIYRYNSSSHRGVFTNGSVISFGYCDSERDVYRYMGAEFDTIRFDELTHFTEQMYVYLKSRLRGVNDYPKQIKSSTNPGGIGHNWVKARFIDIAPPSSEIFIEENPDTKDGSTRIFIPSLVQENTFLMEKDPGYIRRLEGLSKNDRDALLHGSWDLFEGQYFTEWNRSVHVIEPIDLPKWWRRYVVMDYGLDMFACYWIAVDTFNRAYVYREIYTGKDNGGKGVLPSEAAQMIHATNDPVQEYIAPPDLWNRQKDTGRSIADIFAECGIYLRKADNSREQGWLNVKEAFAVYTDELGEPTANLRIFNNCVNLIRCFPSLQYDPKNTKDVATNPHELTHGPDAIRYFFAGRPLAGRVPLSAEQEEERYYLSGEAEINEFLSFGG